MTATLGLGAVVAFIDPARPGPEQEAVASAPRCRRIRARLDGMGRDVRKQRAEALASFAVAGVALVMVVLALGNLALWLHAQNVVVAAAQEAAVVASRENATTADGRETARGLLVSSLGSGADRVTSIDVRADADTVTAEVRGSFGPSCCWDHSTAAPLHATASLEREQQYDS